MGLENGNRTMKEKTETALSATVRPSWILVLLGMLCLCTAAQAMAGSDVEALREAYRGLRTLEGVFSQVTYIKDLEREEHYEGTFHLSVPDRMMWRYTRGSTDEIYINGGEMTVYQPSEAQAFVTSTTDKGLSGSPLRILLDLGRMEEEFEMKGSAGRILLTPKRAGRLVASAELFLAGDGFPLRKIRFVDPYGNTTEITLKDVRVNTTLKESLFLFVPPEGTVIIRQ